MSFAKLTAIGRLGQDPTKREAGSATVCSFSIAISEVSGSGENKKEHTEWISVEAWGTLGDICEKYLKKGSLVYIEAKPRTTTWGEEGAKKTKTVYRLETVEFLEKKSQE